MSGLYNMLFGYQPTAGIALSMLGLTPDGVARFRDAWLAWEGEDPVIVILARTGGGNRPDYAVEIRAVRELPGYRSDADERLDSTYMTFCFDVPPPYVDVAKLVLRECPPPASFQDRFDAAMAQIRSSPVAAGL